MICKNCGEFVNEWDKFCPNCGRAVEEDKEEDVTEVNFEGDDFKEDTYNVRPEEDFYEPYDDRREGFFGLYYNVSEKINWFIEPLLEKVANYTNSFWIILLILTLYVSVFAMITTEGGLSFATFFGAFVACLIFYPIYYFILKALIGHISKKIGFRYGLSEEAKTERNNFIMLGLAFSIVINSLLNKMPLALVFGSILGFLLTPLCFTSVFFRYFDGDQLKRFVKQVFLIEVIFFIVAVVVSLIIIASIGAIVFEAIRGFM